MSPFALALMLAMTHPGGVDAQGCHTERATGQRHCHGERRSQPDNRQRAVPDSPRARDAPTRAFPNCTAARAAGRSNIRRGEPGYGPHLDRDNDGVACESR
ncbi:MAG TPA: excalibur calcium-binding domain-containing protein [Brevundimonas sp.]|jgi:hypothetical protein|uniref:excalibur calcium-binding domain-containing protein n=1 Tax=Brevundimonas sp. TaxID=1871086 RepID=UPI002BDBF812|nr:excalibur calcium-binding domain-containing protein [Brevundimonas sp.]HRH20352.1 excalibur calcium-binding domain-containing protein [Brevundimonas sp.]